MVVILPLNESLGFILPLTNEKQFIFSSILKAGFSVTLFFISIYFLKFVEKLYQKDLFTLHWLRNSLIYLGLSVPLFILIYPGYWVWDELYVLRNAQVYSMEAWQNIFTNIYHTFCLYIIPTGVGIVVIQLAVASIVIGYVLAKVQQIIKKRWPVLLIGLSFLFIPVLLNNLYPLRLTIYSYIELVVLLQTLLLFTNMLKPSHPYRFLFWMSSFIILLAFWRTEGLFFLLLIPVLFIRLGLIKKPLKFNHQLVLLTVYIITIVGMSWAATRYTADPKYQLTATINPLSMLLQYDLKGSTIEDDLKAIDRVIDINLLRDNPSYTEIGALWIKGPRPDFESHMSDYNKAYLNIVLNNPDTFLKTRVQTFLATNSLESSSPPHIGLGTRFTVKDNPEFTYAFNFFYENSRYSHMINEDLKLATTKSLLMINDKNTLIQPFAAVVWTVIPTLLAMLTASFVALWKKRYAWLLIFGILFAQALFIFLTAPANFFMYYLPIYLSGNFFILFFITSLITKKIVK